MAEQVLTDAKIAIGKQDLSGFMNTTRLNLTPNLLDISTFGDNTRRMIQGVKDFSASEEGFYDVTQDADLFDIIDSGLQDQLLSIAERDVLGATAYLALVGGTNYNLGGSHGDVISASIEMNAQGSNVGSGLLFETGDVTATADGTNRALSAASAIQSLIGHLHAFSVSGTNPTLDVIVESDVDTDFNTPTTRLTFTQLTAAGSERKLLAGAITDTFYRYGFTIGGTDTPTFAILAVLAIVNNA